MKALGGGSTGGAQGGRPLAQAGGLSQDEESSEARDSISGSWILLPC